ISLLPYRKNVNLACKTGFRKKDEAEKDLQRSLRLLRTDHFDVYQLHGISSLEEVETAFGPGGVMELMDSLKSRGIARYIGFTAHSEEAALRMLELYPFDTVLFPFNWFLHMEHGMGSRLLEALKEKGAGILAMKAFIERRWEEGEDKGRFPKSWCKPIDTAAEEDFGVAAMDYALSLGAQTLVPPGNFESFRFAVEHIDKCGGKPDMGLLQNKLRLVKGKEFF
ncbi:MAG: aldo/keto reductase, partial [Abditibacteriota bacterium]|nr:aldo/keto reductase [Abditibacteriota bacterium]